MSIIQGKNISFAYEQNVVLKELNIEIDQNEFVGLIGPNGSGKTTLLKILLGLMEPDSGEVLLNNQPLHSLPRKQIARTAAFVPQDAPTGFAFSVRDVVAMGRNPYLGRFQPEGTNDAAIIESAMMQTETLQFANRSMTELSGGERQRVMLAQALAQEPQVMLLDEPIANLDVEHQLETLEFIKKSTQENHCALAALHDLNLAARFCSRLVILHDGKIAADGIPQDILTKDNLRNYFNIQAEITKYESSDSIQIIPISRTKTS